MRVVGQMAPSPESVSFIIEPYVTGGFVLNIGFEQGGLETARAGRWPTPEKAQEIAQRIASELLNGATVAWHSDATH